MEMEPAYAHAIKDTCESFMTRIHVPFQMVRDQDTTFYDDCCQAARNRGISLDGSISILPYLRAGSDIAAIAYGHLSYETRIYTALYTAAAIGLEDACSSEVDQLKCFTLRFIKGQLHGNAILDSYDLLIREMPDYFEPFAAEAMLQSALDFCVGLVMEYELLQKPSLSRPAKQFPTFLRDLTGISRLYSILIFPDGTVPLRSYMEAIPSVIDFVQFVNDIFSFYKEELVHESNNFISVKARSMGITNLEAHRLVANETAEAYEEIIAVLSHNPEALEAFKYFSKGYVYYHLACKRYKLTDLWVCN